MVIEPHKYYILARSGEIEHGLILKQGDSFAIFNHYGNIEQSGLGEQGIYHRGTRYISRLEFFICNTKPFFLSSGVREDNILLTVDLTNPDIIIDNNLFLSRGSLHIFRSKFLFEGSYYERIKIQNFAPFNINLPIFIAFDADFADIFEVRGVKRKKRGERLKAIIKGDAIILGYKGLDGVFRQTNIAFYPSPSEIFPSQVKFHLNLAPKETATLFLTINCIESGASQSLSYEDALLRTKKVLKELRERTCVIFTSNEQFNAWLNRSFSDIFMMLTETPFGLYPYAGIPWFNTIFGRDGIITALECLWINPDIAKGVLNYLAYTQAKEEIPEKDAQPGKIVHEIRKGEMAATGEIPFDYYYGSVDTTPLFIILAGAYYERTGDKEFIKNLWPHIELALNWIDTYGDLDKDSFIEYLPSVNGLVNKGWKDSHDSVFHANGNLAKPPIALVEVQGYVYSAKRKAACLAKILGKEKMSKKLLREAESLKRKFNDIFWCNEINSYALALDGDKCPCKVRTSNAGHALFSGIAKEGYAKRLVRTLFEDHLFSGWGIRTVSSLERAYNPISYHNGSVWPHDNAIIAYGLSRYGFKEDVLKIIKGLFEASTFFGLHRLPELFCGFPRRTDEGPTHYPVACNPQTWSAAAVFFLLQACLGIVFEEKKLCFYRPILPSFLEEIYLENLRVGDSFIHLYLKRYENDVVINVTRKRKDIEIMIVK
ncbi:MAG: amylo-alpha-1,6-glucosidase [Candidatus Desulfofervidus auxilii]|nr:amylo-alpha-1,6-glucosidase [Candidatus Desulfofervidus auxilii]